MSRIAYLSLVLLLLSGCGKAINRVPDVQVALSLPLTDPRLINLSSSGGAVLVNGGVAGLILYRSATNKYLAYDRCSTVNPENRCAVILDESVFTVTDPCTGAKYLLEDGSPVKAPAVMSLKEYQVRITNNNTIQVSN